MSVNKIIEDEALSFCWSKFLPASDMLLCKYQLTPHLFLNVLMRVSQIRVLCTNESLSYLSWMFSGESLSSEFYVLVRVSQMWGVPGWSWSPWADRDSPSEPGPCCPLHSRQSHSDTWSKDRGEKVRKRLCKCKFFGVIFPTLVDIISILSKVQLEIRNNVIK